MMCVLRDRISRVNLLCSWRMLLRMMLICLLAGSGFGQPSKVAKIQSATLGSKAGGTLEKPLYVPGEVLVLVSADLDKSGKLEQGEGLVGVESALGGRIVKTTAVAKNKRMYRVQLPAGKKVEEAIQENWKKQDPRILLVEPNYYLYADATFPNDTQFSSLWGLHNTGQTGGVPDADIDAPEAWDLTTGSPGMIIAVIDTGVDSMHPDLINNMWVNQAEQFGSSGVDDDGNGYVDDIHGYDFYGDDPNPLDTDSHGTHVAGTIAGRGNNALGVTGVNWQCQIMACRFLGPDGYGSTSDAVDCVNYAVDNGARILNNSWGGGGYSETLKVAIENARDNGVLFVAAAGNTGDDSDFYPHYPASYDVENIVSVANTRHDDIINSGSTYGLHSVDLGAPGSAILSSVPAFETLFFEDFESAVLPGFGGTQMTRVGGTPTWATVQDFEGVGKAARTDLTNYPYSGNSDNWIETPPMDTRSLRGLTLTFLYRLHMGDGDTLTADVWDGAVWQNLFTRSNYSYLNDYYYYTILDIPDAYRNASMKVRFRWTTNGTDNDYYGCEIDDIFIGHIGSDYSSAYASFSGTSMASPHVAGTAGLIWSLYPGMSMFEVKSRLLLSGDPLASLEGKTLTGRRLNAYQALTMGEAVELFTPNGGESLPRGYPTEIQWASTSGNPTVDIVLLQGGSVYSNISLGTANDGRFEWTVPGGTPLGSDYQVQIIDGTQSDTSDGYFEVRDPKLYRTEWFDYETFDLQNTSVRFTPEGDGYSVCRSVVSALPTDPTGGVTLPLSDDDYEVVSLAGSPVPFYGTLYSQMYVGSNGYVTFGAGDTSLSDSPQTHFSLPRVAGLLDDLNPSAGGSVTYRLLGDRVAVTWQNVPQFGGSDNNTFQIELFTSGVIRISWLTVSSSDNLVGLSDGGGVQPDYVEEDFSLYGVCSDEPDPEYITLFETDFENGLDGFTLDNTFGDGNGLWHLTDLCHAVDPGHSAVTALWYGQDSSCTYNNGLANQGVVLSPVIHIGGAQAPVQLVFNYLLGTEGAPDSWDRASVEMSVDGGPFTLIAHNNQGEGVYHLVESSSAWAAAAINLGDLVGADVQFRFGFVTVDNISNNFPGFYVDDFEVRGAGCSIDVVGDLNGDCIVNMLDLALLASNWMVDCLSDPGHPACGG